MPSNRIPHHLYKRNHVWWFRKRFVAQGNVIEFRLSLKTSSLNRARLFALRLQTLCLQMVASLGGPSQKKNLMDAKTKATIYAVLRAQIAEWTAEEIERWLSRPERTGEDIDIILEDIDTCLTGLSGRIKLDNRPHLRQAEADIILDKLPHLKPLLSKYDIQVIARDVASGKVESLEETRDIILGRKSVLHSAPSTEAPVLPVPEVHLLSEMISKYQGENEIKKHVKKTQNKYAQCLALTISFFGNVPIASITVAKGREFREMLLTLPVGLATRDMLDSPLQELLSRVKTIKCITTATANSHLEKTRRFFEWMQATGHLTGENPIPKEPLPAPKRNNKAGRHSISDQDATSVFNHKIFTQHIGVLTKKSIQHPHHFWLPLLCLSTGMRPNEACQLYAEDIELVGNCWCVRIDDRFEGQTLKTPSAQRYVPIHRTLIEIGFVRFVEDIRSSQGLDVRLFPEITPVQGYYSHTPGKWFNHNLRDKQNLPREATLYTFRHAFRDKLFAQHPSPEYLQRMMGHQGSDYGLPLPTDVTQMKILVDNIDFSGIVSHVRPYTSLQSFQNFEVA